MLSFDRPFSTALHTAVIVAALAISACATTEPDTGPSDPDAVGAANAEPMEGIAADPTAGLTSITWIAGDGPFGDLDLSARPIEDWPLLLTEPPTSTGLRPIEVTATIERDPDACTLWRRIVTDVAFGEDAAAQRMREATLAALTSIDHDPGALLESDVEPWCTDRPREALAYYAALVTPVFCALPDDTDVRCVTVTSMRYDGGAHGNVVQTDLVLDAASGSLLDVADLLARFDLDPESVAAFVEAAVCELDRASGLLEGVDECWPITLRNARPSASGLILAFSPYESGPYALGPRDLFLPWTELAAGGAIPAEARRSHGLLQDAVRRQDWSAIEALLPADGDFLVATGLRTEDPIGTLRALPRDPLPEWALALGARPGRTTGTTVWPELAVRDPFLILDEERSGLAATFGAEQVRAWEAAGRYLGWRAGFDDDGTWRFIVAGD
jgi:hypothetical protein